MIALECGSPELKLLSRRWSVHGVVLEFQTDHSLVEQLFSDLLRGFASVSSSDAETAIRIRILTGERWDIPTSAVILLPSSNEIVNTLAAYDLKTTFAREGTLNYYEIAPMGGVVYDIHAGWACGYIQNVESYSAWRVAHLLLLIVLLEMLRGQQLFWIHAGAVAHQGKGALIVGQTGSGKTTTVLNLARSGFQFLSEDRTLVRREPDGMQVLGFPLDLAVTPNTLNLLPWLADYTNIAPIGRGKIHLNPLEVFPDVLTDRAEARLILFPTLTQQSTSRVLPLDSAQALMRLLPNSLLASNPDVTQQHFGIMGDLVKSCRSFRLELGPDFDRVPDLIRDLLR